MNDESAAPAVSDGNLLSTEIFRRDVIAGLTAPRKSIPSKYLYDERGSQLFDAICETDDYYVTRTELGLMRRHAAAIADAIGDRALLIEPGSGSSLKTRFLLETLRKLAGYVPVDISREHLAAAAAQLAGDYPDNEILPVCADFHSDFTLPTPSNPFEHRVAYFPGSTIGNFVREEQARLLQRLRKIADGDGLVLIGIDLVKERSLLEAAYDDAEGATEAFSLNLLDRVNRELDADFDTSAFAHRAFWDEEEERIEINLVSLLPQTVNIGDRTIEFAPDESILTEYSHKFRIDRFAEFARSEGLEQRHVWTDEHDWFALLCLEPV